MFGREDNLLRQTSFPCTSLLGRSKALGLSLNDLWSDFGMIILVLGCIVMEQSITFCKNQMVLFSMIDADMEITQRLCSSVDACGAALPVRKRRGCLPPGMEMQHETNSTTQFTPNVKIFKSIFSRLV